MADLICNVFDVRLDSDAAEATVEDVLASDCSDSRSHDGGHRELTHGSIRDVAAVFELVVNFGLNEPAVEAATTAVRRMGSVEVRGVRLPLGEPRVARFQAYIEYAVHPDGLRYPWGPDLDPRSLTSDDMTSVGRALYDLLRQFTGYRAAIVGWDPEESVDPSELEADWQAGYSTDINGLVLADDLCERWHLGSDWVTFVEGYRWLPYAGSRNAR